MDSVSNNQKDLKIVSANIRCLLNIGMRIKSFRAIMFSKTGYFLPSSRVAVTSNFVMSWSRVSFSLHLKTAKKETLLVGKGTVVEEWELLG